MKIHLKAKATQPGRTHQAVRASPGQSSNSKRTGTPLRTLCSMVRKEVIDFNNRARSAATNFYGVDTS
jgi:hypothetical protein